ncbi:hypothetical protein [Arenibacter sp. ARW7G5Y1]|uniref:hypothetical protein n=1 Tax=Arenibacter sp. ARW7G5Y1 TaxID=2135619 RepID=UPI000D757BB8|nr:hypothetical protein [Arenibacter sp. ARW7G5Y1]|tara:strand:+ start:48298 stop:48669 length:372 start_codon:yes stop_codon:yes gene_type:complete
MKNMNQLITIAFFVLSTNFFAQDKQDQQNEIVAVWITADETKIEIYKEGNVYLGNPINSKGERNTKIEVLNLEYTNGKWVGKIYSKKRGKLLDVECLVEGDNLLLEVTTRFISTELEWNRAKS